MMAARKPWRTGLLTGDFDLAAEVARVKSVSKGIGCLVTFLGTARGESAGRKVARLEFEAYRGLAERELAALALEAGGKFGLLGLTILHRLGPLAPGENIVLIVAAGSHRDETYKASRWCIDELKKRVPIWKKEVYAGGHVWVQETP
jgi:molybdopterin synthase catalytic subunit